MKKVIIVSVLLLMMFIGVYFYVSGSHTPYYSSVKSYIKENNIFYDFYDIDSYLDQGRIIRLSDMKKLKIYYNGDPKDNYNITLDKKDYEITYTMYKTSLDDNDVSQETLIQNKYPIYFFENDSSLYFTYYDDSGVSLKVIITKTNKYYDISHMQDEVIQLLEDSIDLNGLY